MDTQDKLRLGAKRVGGDLLDTVRKEQEKARREQAARQNFANRAKQPEAQKRILKQSAGGSVVEAAKDRSTSGANRQKSYGFQKMPIGMPRTPSFADQDETLARYAREKQRNDIRNMPENLYDVDGEIKKDRQKAAEAGQDPLDPWKWTSKGVPGDQAEYLVRKEYEDSKAKEYEEQGIPSAYAKVLANQDYETAQKEHASSVRNRLEAEEQKKNSLEAANAEYASAKAQALHGLNMEDIFDMPAEDREALKNYVHLDNTRKVREGSTPIEFYIRNREANEAFAPLAEKYGEQRAKELAEAYTWFLSQQEYEKAEAKGREHGSGNFLTQVGGNLASVPANIAAGLMAPKERLTEWASRTGQYPTLNPYSLDRVPAAYSGGVREETAKAIEGENGNPIRKGLSYAYQGLMSSADSLARIALSGGNPGISLGLAGLSQFGSAVSEASERGATPGQAVVYGAATAGVEALTEKIPVDDWLNIAKGGKQPLSVAVKNALKQAGVEATTEEISFLSDLILDAAILEEKSGHNQQVRELVAAGYTPQQASEIAGKGLLKEALDTAIVSGISGAGSSAVGSVTAATQDLIADTVEAITNPKQETPVQQTAEDVQRGADAVLGVEESAGPMRNPVDTETAEGYNHLNENAGGTVLSPQETDSGVDVTSAGRYNGNGRSIQTTDVINRLNAGGENTPTIEEVMRLPEIEEAEYANVGTETIRLPNRDLIRENGYQKAMQKGSWNGQDYAGPVRQDRRMDIVIGLPGSGKSSVYTERLSQEHQSRVIDTDDFREYIPEYNGRNAALVHEEASSIKDSVMDTALDNGDNILLSTIGANAKSLEAKIKGYKEDGYSVYLHLNELPNNKSLARAIGRYVGEDGTLGRYVAPDLIAGYGDKPTQTYLYLTGQGGSTNGETGGLAGNLRQSRAAGTGDAGTSEGKTGSQAERGSLLAGYDWYNNDVQRGQPPRLIQTSENETEAGTKPIGESPVTGSLATSNSPASMNSIPQNGENVKENPGKENLSAAKEGFTGKQEYYDLLTDENTQRDRPGDVRPVEVPKKDASGKHVSEFVGNAYGSALTSDAMANRIEELARDNVLGFDRQSNEKSLLGARDYIFGSEETGKGKGVAATRAEITRAAERGKIGTDDIAKAIILYEEYNSQKGAAALDNATEVFLDLQQMATRSGRNLQLFKLFRQMSPEGKFQVLEKEVQRTLEHGKKHGKITKDSNAVIPPELESAYKEAARTYMNTKSEQTKADAELRMNEVQNTIYEVAASQMKATFQSKWNALRYMAMMGNVKTNIRNVAGNTLMMPYTAAKRAVGAALEQMIPKDQRTKSILNPLSENDAALKAWASADAGTFDVEDALRYSAKLGDSVKMDKIEENRRIFDSGILESYRKLTEMLPEKGDMLFKNHEYAASLAGFLKARGYTAEQVQNGEVDKSVLMEARTYAIEEAMRATFNDCNAFSDMISSLGRSDSENPWAKAMNILGEGAMPFRRTPANVVVRAWEYSPGEMLRGLWHCAFDVKNGKVSAATAIDRVSSGLVGSAACVLGMALFKGIGGIRLTSRVDEDEKRKGHQDYALEFSINGKTYSYTIDWAAPANLPLFVGVNFAELLWGDGEQEGLNVVTRLVYAARNTFEPMLSLSCLSSLNDLIESAKYAEEGTAIYTLVASAATSYFMQAIPAPLRQAAQAVHKNQQVTFANSQDPLLRDMQRTISRVPFADDLLKASNRNLGTDFPALKTDRIDEWGQPVSNGSPGRRAFDAFVNPGRLKTIQETELEREITRLNGILPNDFSPPAVGKTITYTDTDGVSHKDQRLTQEQYDTLARTQGSTQKQILDEVMDSDVYAAMTDAQKGKVFESVYDYAREKGRTEAIQGYDGMAGWMKGMEEGKEVSAILNRVASSEFSDAFDSMTQAWDNGWEQPDSYDGLNRSYDIYSAMPEEDRAAFLEETGGRSEAYIKARDSGVPTETFAGLYRQYREIDHQDKDSGEKAQEFAYVLEKAKDRGEITGAQKGILKEKLGFRFSMPAGTETFDKMLDEGMETDTADMFANALANAKGTGNIDPDTGKRSITDHDRYRTITYAAGVSDADKDAAMHAILPDYDPKAKRPEKTELKYDYARNVLGLSPQEFTQSYAINGRYDKKQERLDAWQEMGLSKETANELYKLYGGRDKRFNQKLLELYGG